MNTMHAHDIFGTKTLLRFRPAYFFENVRNVCESFPTSPQKAVNSSLVRTISFLPLFLPLMSATTGVRVLPSSGTLSRVGAPILPQIDCLPLGFLEGR